MRTMLAPALLLSLVGCGVSSPSVQDLTPMQQTTDSAGSPTDPTSPGDPGIPSGPVVDYTCSADADCVVRNIGNCCGWFPVCTSEAYVLDAAAVQAWCTQNQVASACGWPRIDRCACDQGRCISLQGTSKVWPLD